MEDTGLTALLVLIGPTIAVVAGYFIINAKLSQLLSEFNAGVKGLSNEHSQHDNKLGNALEKFEESVDENFERHREDHQDHHREIDKLFKGVSAALNAHISDVRVDAAHNSHNQKEAITLLREIKDKLDEKKK